MQRSGFTKIAIAAVFCFAAVVPSPAQTFTTLVNFDGSNGSVTSTPWSKASTEASTALQAAAEPAEKAPSSA